jgi:hypothetical protein
MILKNGGWKMFIMIESEKYQWNDKREAEKGKDKILK